MTLQQFIGFIVLCLFMFVVGLCLGVLVGPTLGGIVAFALGLAAGSWYYSTYIKEAK